MPRYIIFLCVYFDHLPLARVRRQNEIASRVGHGHLRMIANRNSCSGYHSKVFIHHNSANHRGGFGDQWNRGGRVIIVRQDDHRLTLHKLILGDGGESHFAVGRPRLRSAGTRGCPPMSPLPGSGEALLPEFCCPVPCLASTD